MLFKKVSVFLISAIIFFSFFSFGFSSVGQCSGEWVEVIKDSKDSGRSADIKSISVKDDGKDWSFKMESWKDWDLESCHGAILLAFNTSGSRSQRDSDYGILIVGSDDTYIGLFLSFDDDVDELISCDFNSNDDTGTFSISKEFLVAKKNQFSIASYIIYLPEENTYLDAAPDDQKMKLFKSDGKPAEPKLGVDVTDLKFGEVQKSATEYLPVRISNEGAGTIKGTITCSENIRSSRSTFTLDDFDETEISVIVCLPR